MNNQTLTASVNDRILSILKDISNTTNLIGTYGVGFDIPTSYTVPMFWLRMTDNRLKPEEPGEFLYITYNLYYYDNIGDNTTLTNITTLLEYIDTNYTDYLDFTMTRGTTALTSGKGVIETSFKLKVNVEYMLALEDDCCNVLKIEGQPGERGLKGDSAYQAWIDLGNLGTEQDFIDSLKGQNGIDGTDGDSAYQIWLDEGNTGTEQDFLDSLKGEQGLPGTDGASDWVDITNKPTTLLGYGITDAYPLVGNPSNFLTSISGINAGGELAGTYPNPTILNSSVLNKVLTGYNTLSGTLNPTDSILQAFGKVQNQINGLIGGTIYQGIWNASTNTPSLTSGVGTSGHYYIVSTNGSTNLDGITDWKVGDWVIFHGTSWQKVDNTDAVVSVNGFTGAVNLTSANIPEVTNLYYTNARVKSYGDTQWSLLGHTHDASDVVSGIFNAARLGSGSPSSSNFLRGDGTWATLIVPVEATVSEINTGTDNTKFISSLGLEGSKYLDQDNTKLYGVTTGTATAYVLTTTPSFTPVNGTVLYVKFHLANTGAATINVNGSGAVALQKDLSTALVANDIPVNSEYQIIKTSTGWLVKDIGFAGRNTSARLLGALTDATGTGVNVFGTSPSFTTSVVGGATFAAFNTVTTNLSLGGAATTMSIGGTPTTALTATLFGNSTATGVTKTLNIGTGGASGSTTALTLGSNTSGSTNNINLNLLPASDAAWDLYTRNASGFLERIANGATGQVLTATTSSKPTWATPSGGGGGSGWDLTGNLGTTAGTNFVGTKDNVDLQFKRNSTFAGQLTASVTSYGVSSFSGTGNSTAFGFGALKDTLIAPGNSTFGYQSMYTNFGGKQNSAFGHQSLYSCNDDDNAAYGYQSGVFLTGKRNTLIGSTTGFNLIAADNNIIIGYNQQGVAATSTNTMNIGGLLFGSGMTGSAASPAGQLGIGIATPNASSIVDINSTTKGVLLPRMTDAQIRAIPSPANGLLVYNTTLEKLCVYELGAWKQVVTTLM